jgi:hypothetical protein
MSKHHVNDSENDNKAKAAAAKLPAGITRDQCSEPISHDNYYLMTIFLNNKKTKTMLTVLKE